jgi:hypothetical protein
LATEEESEIYSVRGLKIELLIGWERVVERDASLVARRKRVMVGKLRKEGTWKGKSRASD